MSDPNGLHWGECPRCTEIGINEDSECCYYCKAEYCSKCKDFTIEEGTEKCEECGTRWGDGREITYEKDYFDRD